MKAQWVIRMFPGVLVFHDAIMVMHMLRMMWMARAGMGMARMVMLLWHGGSAFVLVRERAMLDRRTSLRAALVDGVERRRNLRGNIFRVCGAGRAAAVVVVANGGDRPSVGRRITWCGPIA